MIKVDLDCKLLLSSGFGAVVVAVFYGLLFDTRDVILSEPLSLTFHDYLSFILLAAFGLLGFLLLTRYK